MKKANLLLHDLLKILVIGLAAAAAGGLVLFGGGFLFGRASVSSGLEATKDGLLLIGALLLFLLAGMLLRKGKHPEPSFQENGWRKHFRVIGPKTALGVIAAALLLAASAVDSLLLRM